LSYRVSMPKRAAAPAFPKPPKTSADTKKILSAQCTDERVNQVTPALFKRYPNASALAKATTDELEPQIQSTGFFRAKSRSLVGMASEVVEHHKG